MSTGIQATLEVIHIFDYPTLLDDFSLKAEDAFPDIEGGAFKKHNSKLNDFCKEHLGSDLEKMNVEFEVIEDKSVVDGIISKANKIEPLLIITGMKGGSSFREIIMGNTAKHLIAKSSYPVLTIPEDASHKQPQQRTYLLHNN